MSQTVRALVAPEAVQGLKHFHRLRPLLQHLHDAGTERDLAGNRTLHFDEYCALLILMMFNPTIRSLRAIQQMSNFAQVQKALGVSRTSLGSLSESARVFDAERMLPIIGKLAKKLHPTGHDPRLKDFKQILTAVDGTILKALPCLAEAMWVKTRKGLPQYAWRLHTHFDVLRGVPIRMHGSDAGNRGAANEKAVLRGQLEADHCYVVDRGYAQFALFNAIVAAGSSYVCRLRDDSNFTITEQRPLTAEAEAAGIIQDAIVHLGCKAKRRPKHAVHLLTIAIRPNPRRRRTGPSSNGRMLIATNLLDVPAAIIALIYQYRWTIETFFRFFKQILGCRHLLSACPNGIAIEAYCAIIACMLLNIYTGCKPRLRTYEVFCLYLQGWVTDAELVAHLEKIKSQA